MVLLIRYKPHTAANPSHPIFCICSIVDSIPKDLNRIMRIKNPTAKKIYLVIFNLVPQEKFDIGFSGINCSLLNPFFKNLDYKTMPVLKKRLIVKFMHRINKSHSMSFLSHHN